ncbi:hypothetical protein [Helicobacter labacensis]|uniref:hypothetical protein n=1 Tax=Helicobacter labacensis TaxID=2316079 RepID=UPI0013CE0BBB|nr:hypothetical protein [Helicobacter labacensis]
MTAQSNPQLDSEAQPINEQTLQPVSVSSGKKTPKPLTTMTARELQKKLNHV